MPRLYMIKGTVVKTSRKGKVREKEYCLGFVRSELQAKKAVTHIAENTEDIHSIYYEPEDIPNDKGGMIKWLNDYCMDIEDVQDLITEVLEEY